MKPVSGSMLLDVGCGSDLIGQQVKKWLGSKTPNGVFFKYSPVDALPGWSQD
jgi:hypothetical protein